MKNLKIKLLIIISALVFASHLAEAHQPNFTNTKKYIEILNPEVSQAFYGSLDGEPINYSINTDSPLQLYIGLLTPDLPGQQNNLIAVVQNNQGEQIVKLDGNQNFQWERWYEEFAGDWYWKGPEFKQEIPAGQYTVIVSNPDNTGKYVLAVGALESFPIAEMPRMIKELILIKTEFFNKPWYTAFQNKIGYGLGILMLILVIIISSVIFIIKFLRRKYNAH